MRKWARTRNGWARSPKYANIDQEDYLYRENVRDQTISLQFTAKPDKALRALLRRAGFVLRPSRSTYERRLDSEGIEAAAYMREYLNKRIH